MIRSWNPRRRNETPVRVKRDRRSRMCMEPLEDRQLMATFSVSSLGDSGTGSLRQAIINSDSTPATVNNPNVISFSGLHNIAQIQLSSQLPTITQPVIIDGTTESSYNGAHPFVQLLGSSAGSALGLDITASGTQVKALAIDAFSSGGVLIDNASNVTLTGDYIGIDPNNNATGQDANGNIVYEGNGVYGLTIQSENGGSSTGNLLSNDIVSANDYNGIILSGLNTTKNVISGTIIGSDNTGAAVVDDPGNALGNGQRGGGGSGIVINGGASYNTIGGTTTSAKDVILGNKSYGIYITDSGTYDNVVEGDVIGTDITGMHGADSVGRSYGNGVDGVGIVMGAGYNVVSGTTTAPEVISNNGASGVLISGLFTSSNIVEGVHIGTDITGETALPNAGDGVTVTSAASSNFIGLPTSTPNIISGNAGNGVTISGFDTDENFVENNLIGIDANGVTALGNAGDGVHVNGQASSNFIGYAASNSGNVISGNIGWGIYISDSGTNLNTVANNLVGTDAAGKHAVPNDHNGIDVVFGAQNNTIGGTTTAARNVISGNLFEGVLIGFSGTTGNVVEGNFIGTDITGKAFLANSQQLDGVYEGLGAGSNTIGGQNSGATWNLAAWNVISGNSVNGILVTDSGTTGAVISGNFIGTDVTGTVALPNGGNGVTIAAGTSNTTVGSVSSDYPNLNVIAGNLGDGVSITSSTGNVVGFDYVGVDLNNTIALGNMGNGVSIHAANNNVLGFVIDRYNGGDGILTDQGTTGTGWSFTAVYGNGAGSIVQVGNPTPQAIPVITGVTTDATGRTTVTGVVTGSPDHNANLDIEIYATPATPVFTGNQGETFISQVNVTSDNNGNASFSTILPSAIAGGELITAMADLSATQTSALSTPVAVPGTATLGDAGFESPVLPAGTFKTDPTGTIWTFSGQAGISANNSPFTSGNPNAPQGTQVAYVQRTGSFNQSVVLPAGTYQISFDAAQRGNYLTSHEDFNVLVDGNVVGTFKPGSTSYASFATSTFSVTAGTHTVTFQGLDTVGGDNTVFLDALSLVPGVPTLANAGFESPNVGNGFVVDPTNASWTFSGQSGISGNGSAFTSGNPNAPQGTQVAYVQRTGSFNQSVAFPAGSYQISFDAAQRGNYLTSHEDFNVLVDGTVVGTFKPGSTSYASFATSSFTVSAGSHTITFQGLDTVGGDNTVFLDAVTLLPAAPTPANAGFEAPNVGHGFVVDPTNAGWTFSGQSGISGNGSAFTSGNPNAPQGAQVAYVQRTGSFTQNVTGWTAGTYQISFDAAQRGNYLTSHEDFNVLVDGTVVGTFKPGSISYAGYATSNFTVSAGSHTITFQGLDSVGGDNTVFLDAVTIVTIGPAGNTPAQPANTNLNQTVQPLLLAAGPAATTSTGSGITTNTVKLGQTSNYPVTISSPNTTPTLTNLYQIPLSKKPGSLA